MFVRAFARAAMLLCLGVAVAGCGNPSGLDSIQISPTSQALTVGQTTQFTVTGTFGNSKHPTSGTVTTGVTWTSSSTSVATVTNAGLVSAVSAGTATITAEANAYNGPVTSSAIVTVSGAGSAGGTGNNGGSLVSLTVIPSQITVGNLQDTGQFLAIGTFTVAPFVRDLTNSPTLTWISATPSVFPVSNSTGGTLGATAGVVTAYGNGSGVITAEAKNPADGTIQTATANFNCPLVLPNPPTTAGSCFPGSQAPALLATLTIYNEGLNTTTWDVTAPSATGTPDVLHCGPGDPSGTSVCTATYPFTTPATSVVLKASGGAFGGWSYNCIPSTASGSITDANGNAIQITANGPNYCVITFDPAQNNTNVTVGAIFN